MTFSIVALIKYFVNTSFFYYKYLCLRSDNKAKQNYILNNFAF